MATRFSGAGSELASFGRAADGVIERSSTVCPLGTGGARRRGRCAPCWCSATRASMRSLRGGGLRVATAAMSDAREVEGGLWCAGRTLGERQQGFGGCGGRLARCAERSAIGSPGKRGSQRSAPEIDAHRPIMVPSAPLVAISSRAELLLVQSGEEAASPLWRVMAGRAFLDVDLDGTLGGSAELKKDGMISRTRRGTHCRTGLWA